MVAWKTLVRFGSENSEMSVGKQNQFEGKACYAASHNGDALLEAPTALRTKGELDNHTNRRAGEADASGLRARMAGTSQGTGLTEWTDRRPYPGFCPTPLRTPPPAFPRPTSLGHRANHLEALHSKIGHRRTEPHWPVLTHGHQPLPTILARLGNSDPTDANPSDTHIVAFLSSQSSPHWRPELLLTSTHVAVVLGIVPWTHALSHSSCRL